jgi:glycerol kinase
MKLISVIDAGTNKIKFVIYKTPSFEEVVSHEIRISQISLKEGHLEHDPKEIISAIRECARVAIHLLPNHGFSKGNIACFGVTNQRETVVLWDKQSGEPLHNAIGEKTDLAQFLDFSSRDFFLSFVR